MDSQWSKHEACFVLATQVCLAVTHNTSITSGEWVWCSKRIAWAIELGSCQSNLWKSWGYERFQKFKDLLNAWFENVNILVSALYTLCPNGFFLLAWCNKHGMVYCIYWGVTGYNFHIKNVFLLPKIGFVIANSVDPDVMPHYAAFHLGLHFWPKKVLMSN